jgi:aminopeptidase YwaD
MAQYQRDRGTMLPAETLKAIATELSGARAFNNIVEIAGYEYDRTPAEYASVYRETAVTERLAKAYGFDDVRVTRLPVGYRQWDGEDAELWVTSPSTQLISRYLDHPAMLVYGSQTADVTASLVWVGRGLRDSDYNGKDVRGKIVLTDGAPGPVHDIAVRKHGAAGVVSFVNEYGFGIDAPDELAQVRLSNASDESLDAGTTFGIVLSHRQGTKLLEMVETTDDVKVHVRTKASRHPADHQVVEGWIHGDGTSDQEVVIVAHLFEGIAKQGANDDTSGCGASLEIGRAWVKLIREGVLPRPKRAVHFLWVPEIIYAAEYWKKYPDVPKNTLAMTSMDIVGSNQTINRNEQRVLLTPYSLPSFLNELYIQYMRWMEDTQTIKFHNLRSSDYSGRYMQNPITDPQGTQDPFHIRIMKHAGGSDHLPFLRSYPRVAGVHFMNWPDVHYHTSEDLTKFIDPTQLKRAAMITMCVTLVMANATPDDALRLAGLTAGHAVERIGDDLTQAMEMMQAAGTGDLDSAYKEGLVLVHQAYRREAAAIASNAKMMGGDAKALKGLIEIEKSLTDAEPSDVTKLQAVYKALATSRGVPVRLTPPRSEPENAASKLFPRPGSGDPYVDFTASDQPSMHPGRRELALYDEEAKNFADGTRSVLEIRDAISAELGPVDVNTVTAFFRGLQNTGKWIVADAPQGALQ